MSALEVAAIGLRNDLKRLELVAQNVANASTMGYKRQLAVQKPFLTWMAAGDSVNARVDSAAGKLQATNASMDVALPSGSYLLVETDGGAQLLTRNGALRFDAHGILRTGSGQLVLGARGPIQVDAASGSVIEVDHQGQLMRQGQLIDALRLVSLKSGASLTPMGDGLYATDPDDWQAEMGSVAVLRGQLEQSNVSLSHEMVSLTAATRHAETMARLFQAADDMVGTAIRRLSENL